MTWTIFRGDGHQRSEPIRIPDPPPWRRFANQSSPVTFQTTPELVQAINAAIHLRRPLLLTGNPGSGKSSVADAVAHELNLGNVLRWNVTSRSTLTDAIYSYDALGRLQHHQLAALHRDTNPTAPDTDSGDRDDITRFLQLGPLGTALVASTPNNPRVLLVDELDKGELDLPSDLLNVFERGEYTITELARHTNNTHNVTGTGSDQTYTVTGGELRCVEFPIVIMTSNGEREFPAPFLRRCVRFDIGTPTPTQLHNIVAAHFNPETAAEQGELIEQFTRLSNTLTNRPTLAIDQLLNAVHLLSGAHQPTGSEERTRLVELLLRELDRT